MNLTVTPQTGLLPRLGLIVFLSGTLYYVLPKETTADNQSAVSLIVSDVIETQLPKLQSPAMSNLLTIEGGEMSLAQLIENNPFQQPDTLHPASLTADQQAAAGSTADPLTPPTITIQAVMPGRNGLMVLVENEIYGVGDQLPCGAVIANIDTNSVRFHWPAEQETNE